MRWIEIGCILLWGRVVRVSVIPSVVSHRRLGSLIVCEIIPGGWTIEVAAMVRRMLLRIVHLGVCSGVIMVLIIRLRRLVATASTLRRMVVAVWVVI